MSLRSIYTAAVTALLTTQAVAARDEPAKPNGISSGLSAIHANFTEWTARMGENANASVKVVVPGYDVSKPFKKNDQPLLSGDLDWVLTLSVSSDLHTSGQEHPFFTGAAITLQPPESLYNRTDGQPGNVTKDPSWSVGMTLWQIDDLHTKDSKVNDTCHGVLPDECRKDMERLASSSSRDTFLPKSCRDKYKDYTGLGTRSFFNNTDVSKGWPGFYFGGDTYETSNSTDYDEYVRQTWVVITAWRGNSSDGQEQTMRGSLSCLHTTNYTDDSRTASAGATLQAAKTRWMAMVAAWMTLALAL